MRRREFITTLGGAAAWPLGARAQRSDKVFRVGSLYMADAFRRFGFDQAFISGMHELGYVEGQNIVYDTRHAAGDRTRLPALVDELILLKPDVLATGEPIVPVVLSKTSTIPIVMFYSSDPVAAGLVKSLSHPGDVGLVQSRFVQARSLSVAGVNPTFNQGSGAAMCTIPAMSVSQQSACVESLFDYRRGDGRPW